MGLINALKLIQLLINFQAFLDVAKLRPHSVFS